MSKNYLKNFITLYNRIGLAYAIKTTWQLFSAKILDKLPFTTYLIKKSRKLPKDKLNIGIYIQGAYGDNIKNANYIYKFLQKYSNENVQVDILGDMKEDMMHSVYNAPGLFRNKYIVRHYSDKMLCAGYDLTMSITWSVKIINYNRDRVLMFAPNMLELIDILEKCERYDDKRKQTRAQKWLIQLDTNGVVGLTERYEYPIQIDLDENEFLKRHDLFGKKYILLHFGTGLWTDAINTKMWQFEKFNTLISLLKAEYPDFTLVQMGVSSARCPNMTGVDLNLIGKTNMEGVKVLLKNTILLIDCEGGMAHLRHALVSKPSAIIFGPNSADYYGYSENFNIQTTACDIHCEEIHKEWMTKCIRGHNPPICTASITPEYVFDTIKEYLDSFK